MCCRLVVTLLFIPATLMAQRQQVQLCPTDALDPTFQAYEDSDHIYTLALNLRNVSRETCWFPPSPNGTGMSPDRTPDGTGVQICYYCEETDHHPASARITLAPGEAIHQTRSWATIPGEYGEKCLTPTYMIWNKFAENDSTFSLNSRSLLKPICSEFLTTDDYAPGLFLSDTVASLQPSSSAPQIKWANDDKISPTRGHLPLRVTIKDPAHLLALDGHSCPRLFTRVRDATPDRGTFSRKTSVDEVQNVTCKKESADGAKGYFVMEFDASYALTPKNNDENRGEYTVDVSALAEIRGRYIFVSTTNGIHLSMFDGKLVQRNWGSPVEGVAVSLTLDKNVYELGSDVPLHAALENVDSPAIIAAMDPYYDPPGIEVELEDSDGKPISPKEIGGWIGHGYCHEFLPGLVFPVERRLSEMGFRPKAPGVYKVVAIWRPSDDSKCGRGKTTNLITVRSPAVEFRIIPKTDSK